MKIYLTIFISSLLFAFSPLAVYAAYSDVILGASNTIINVGGIDLTLSGTGATVDSITVDSGSFSVTLSANAGIQVTSSDRRRFSVSSGGGSESQSFTCSSSNSVLAISNPSSGVQVTMTVTPLSDFCSVAGGGG